MKRDAIFRLVALLILVVLLCAYIMVKFPQFYESVFSRGSKTTDPSLQTLAPAVTNTKDFFIDYRLERERTRSQQADLLRELINNAQADDASRKSAGERWLTMVSTIGTEGEIESLIRAKGFADAVVFMQDKSTVVVVKATEVSQPEAAKIMDIVTRGTGMKLDAISLIVKPQ
jgi:stage III sporulation protein AH